MKLNEKSKANVLNRTGILFEDMVNMDTETIDAKIEEKKGKRIAMPKAIRDQRLIARGNIYLRLGRTVTRNEINKRLSLIGKK